MTTGPDTLALADSLMEAMGFKRVAIVRITWSGQRRSIRTTNGRMNDDFPLLETVTHKS